MDARGLGMTAGEFFTAHRLREWLWLYALPYLMQGGNPLPPSHCAAFAGEIADPAARPPPALVALLAASAAQRARDTAEG